MSKALAFIGFASFVAAVWLTGALAFAEPVPDEPPPDPAEATERVATARQQHGKAIEEKYRAVGVAYPGEIFLRWFKREAALELWARNGERPFQLVETYLILKSSGEPGPKRKEGDRQVPEGFYEVDRFNPLSKFHLSLGLNYPNAADLVLSDHDAPGSDIFIHGGADSIGCAPLGDDSIEEVYLAALDAHAHGQEHIQVHIFPDRMSGEGWKIYAAEEAARRPELAAFWDQLRPGFEYFEQHHQLPVVTVTAEGRYEVSGRSGR